MQLTHLSLCVADDAREMAEIAAEIIAKQSQEAIAKRGKFSLAISGGKTPVPLFRLLSSKEWEKRIEWPKSYVYWVDERCVSIESEESNYRRAHQELLSKVDTTNYYRMRGEVDPEKAAKDYSALLREHFNLKENEFPRFDCVLLGLGEEGHTASIYAQDPAVREQKKIVTDVYIPKLKKSRLTMTLPVLNNSRCCLFLASGEKKHKVLDTALHLLSNPTMPAQMVRPHKGKLCWVIDRAAFRGEQKD